MGVVREETSDVAEEDGEEDGGSDAGNEIGELTCPKKGTFHDLHMFMSSSVVSSVSKVSFSLISIYLSCSSSASWGHVSVRKVPGGSCAVKDPHHQNPSGGTLHLRS